MSGLQSHDSVVLGYPHGTGTKVEVGGWVWVHTRGAQTTYMGSPSSERKVRFSRRPQAFSSASALPNGQRASLYLLANQGESPCRRPEIESSLNAAGAWS